MEEISEDGGLGGVLRRRCGGLALAQRARRVVQRLTDDGGVQVAVQADVRGGRGVGVEVGDGGELLVEGLRVSEPR